MGAYQDSVLTAWKKVNQVTSSLELTGAAPAFRQAVAQTDFKSVVPAYEFGNFKVYVLDWLEGQMVYVDNAQEMAVVPRLLWTIMSCDHRVLDNFIDDMSEGASGVKVIDYDSGRYRDAGAAWRKMNSSMTPPQDDLTTLENKLTSLLERATAIRDAPGERSTEQYQALFTEIAATEERYEELQARTAKMGAMLDFARGVVFSL